MKKADYSRPDYYSRMAKEKGFAARSVFKLAELDSRYGILRHGMRVLDLGASPGSWMQYCAEKVGGDGLVLGIDRKPLNRQLKANERFMLSDVFMAETAALRAQYGAFDLVLSDLAPETIGSKFTDSARSIALAERACQFVEYLLKPGGKFLVKAFQGGDFDRLLKFLRTRFAKVLTTKPKSSRSSSREMYIYCQGFANGGATEVARPKLRADRIVRGPGREQWPSSRR
jgi:23S rRNA (uridine2552-2'-O)-methyltransferase